MRKEFEKTMVVLKVKLEGALEAEQNLMDQQSERRKNCNDQEAEIISLKE